MGLFGLATLAARRRVTEIGSRKALGASVASIVRLLSFDFLKLVALAFAVRRTPGVRGRRAVAPNLCVPRGDGDTFFAAGTLALGVALLAMLTQTVRSARTDPARTLRDK